MIKNWKKNYFFNFFQGFFKNNDGGEENEKVNNLKKNNLKNNNKESKILYNIKNILTFSSTNKQKTFISN